MVFFTKYYYSNQENEDNMDRTLGTHRIKWKCIQNFGRKTSREETGWETKEEIWYQNDS